MLSANDDTRAITELLTRDDCCGDSRSDPATCSLINAIIVTTRDKGQLIIRARNILVLFSSYVYIFFFNLAMSPIDCQRDYYCQGAIWTGT